MTLRVLVDARLVHWPGIGRYIGILLRGLVARTDVSVSALTAPGHVDAMPSGVTIVPVVAAPFSLAEQFELKNAMGVVAADVFHSPHFNIPLFGRTPLVATLHDAAPFRFPPEGLRGIPRRTYTSLFYAAAGWRAAAVITDSAFSQREIAELTTIPLKRITPIHLAIDAEFIALADAVLADGKDLTPTATSRPYVLYVGTNKPWKNLEVAVRGVDAAAKKVPGLRLLIAGKQAANQEPLEALLARVRPSLPVGIVGTVSDEQLSRLYRDALAVLCPSLYEGFGLTGLEAMACGAPVVHSGAASLPEVLGEVALTANPYVPEEWAEAICRLAEDPSLQAARSLAGQVRARTFSVDRMIDQTVAVYRRVVPSMSSYRASNAFPEVPLDHKSHERSP